VGLPAQPILSALVDHADAAAGANDHMRLFVEELGVVGEPVVELTDLAGSATGVQNRSLRDADIGTFQDARVFDVLGGSFADQGQNAEIVAVVNNREIRVIYIA